MDIYQLIQVTWDMSEETTRRREISGIIEAAESTSCRNLLIITEDSSKEIKLENGMIINVMPAWRWLLGI